MPLLRVLDVLSVPVLRLDPGLPLPGYAHAGDAGADLRARVQCKLGAGERTAVPTGIKVAIPAGWAGLVLPRSGLARRHGIGMVNAPGLVDSGYRGELEVLLVNHDPHETFVVERGSRIAQLVLVQVGAVVFEEVPELEDSARGEGGFGSSGLH